MHRLGFATLAASLLLGTGGVAFDLRAGDACSDLSGRVEASNAEMCTENEVQRVSIRVGSVANVAEIREGYASLNTRGYNYVADEGFRPPVANAASKPPSAAKR